MKHVGNAYGRVSSLLREYVRPLGMLCEAGPLRVMRELTAGIVFTGSVQLTNAARLFATTRNQLAGAVERMGGHLADEKWDHRDWAGAVLHQQAAEVGQDDLGRPDPAGRDGTGQAICPAHAVPVHGEGRQPGRRPAGQRLLVLGRVPLGREALDAQPAHAASLVDDAVGVPQ